MQYRAFMMINPEVAAVNPKTRNPSLRHYVMTRPAFFDVEYAINPWMDTDTAVDVDLANLQWERLRDTYRELGHTVDVVEPVAGLPDMVFAANAGLIVNGAAIVARFKHAEREGESAAYAEWMTRQGYAPVKTRHINEGQGDLLVVGGIILAGTGFRTDPRAHREVAEITGMPVLTLELVDPRFYHLDTALMAFIHQPSANHPGSD
jgi:N-dimethylarginine dimethylaminohydrolase